MGKRGRGVAHSLLLALFVVAGCGGSDDEGPVLAVGVEEGGLYVVDGEAESRGTGLHPAWSPDGTRLAFVRDGDVYVDDRRLAPGDRPQWTPDGRSLIVEREGIRLLEVESGSERLLTRGTTPQLSPDGSTVAFVRTSSLHTFPLDGGTPRRWAVLADPVVALRWLADGTELAALQQNARTGATRIERIAGDGSKRVIARSVGEYFDAPPAGDWIAFTPALQGGLSIARADGTDVRHYALTELGPGAPMSLTWSRDGSELAFAVGGQNEIGANFVSIVTMRADGDDVRQLARVDGLAADIAWYPRQP